MEPIVGDRYRQRQLLENAPDLAWSKSEDQWFDRKSVKIKADDLAVHLIGFANAEGGTIVVGIEKDGTVTGIDGHDDHVNRLRQCAIDFTTPPVAHTVSELDCIDHRGNPNHLLVFEIDPSEKVHRTTRGDVLQRIGDQTRRLNEESSRELAFSKGEMLFDESPVPGVTLEDLDESAIQRYVDAVGGERDRVLRSRGFIKSDGASVTWAGVLMFGLIPQAHLPNASIRILRFDGVRATTGRGLNVSFDRRVEGTLSAQVAEAAQIMGSLLRELTWLDERTGRFITVPELPRFAWYEAIVNAVTHRSYNLQGDHVRVSLFDNRVVIDSPGRLPGLVRIDNIRRARFSRNPRLTRALVDLRLVRELNEGVNRMFDEMQLAGLPEPQLEQTEAGFRVTLYNQTEAERTFVQRFLASMPPGFASVIDRLFREGTITTSDAATLSGFSRQHVRRRLQGLEDQGYIRRVGLSPSDPASYWELAIPLRARWRVPALPPASNT